MAMEKQVNLQCNEINHLVMYGIYNSDTLEKLITTCIECIMLQLGMKIYLLVSLTIGFNGICLRMELAIVPLILSYLVVSW